MRRRRRRRKRRRSSPHDIHKCGTHNYVWLGLSSGYLFRHPGDVLRLWAHDRSCRSLDISGHMFVDGSCATHTVKELSRAVWGIAVVGDDGDEVCRISCPLWAPNLQTAQGGEFGAYAVAAMHALPGSSIYSDCNNVVVQANEPLMRA
eukprot:3388035-Pyramimonas_sp.AAC.1